MATPNYSYEKRQKELAKKRKKEDKLKRKGEEKPEDELNVNVVQDPDAVAQTQPGQPPAKSAS